MGTYLYSITINIDEDVRKVWLQWMKDVFIPEILNTKLFVSNNFLELVNEEKNEGATYSLQLFLESESQFLKYEEEYYEKHQEMLYTKFQNKFVEFRTLLKKVD